MGNDRNTFAKRQREMEKRRKADDKRVRRIQRGQQADELREANRSQSLLSPEELSVLSVFRKYLMTPGKMLSLVSSDLDAFDTPLTQLLEKRMIVAEKFRGGYSLTESGFAAMKESE